MNEIDAYIGGLPESIQEKLNAIRSITKEIALQATERICIRMSTFDLNGNV